MQFSKIWVKNFLTRDVGSKGINDLNCSSFEFEGSRDIQHLEYSLTDM